MAVVRRGHTIVAYLAVFGASILLPVLALFAIVLWQGFTSERGRIEQDAREGARNVAISVDQQIGAFTSMLQALATSPALERGDLRMFHQQMASLAGSQNLLISLRDLNSRQILNSAVPFGDRLPPLNDTNHDRIALATGAPAVSRFAIGAITGQPQFAVVVPVFRDGVIVYLLGTANPLDRLTTLARGEVPSPRFLVRIVDQENKILAIIPDRPQLLGQDAGPPPDAAASWHDTVDGTEVWWAARQMAKVPWRADVGVPIDVLYGPLWGRLIGLILLAGALAGVAAAAAVLFGHRIGGAVEAIVGAAAALGRGERVKVRPSHIREIDVAVAVLDRAGRQRDRREADLVAGERRLAEAAEALARLNADLERQVRQRTEQAEAALRELFETRKMESIGQLTGGVAHDFNNLLMAILSTVGSLKRYLPADARAQRLAEAAMEAAERGAALTQRLLAFARRQDLCPTSVNIVAVISGMMSLFKTSAGPKIELALEIDPETPRALVDRNQLELAVLNLVVNARDAMPEGGWVEIAVEPFAVVAGAVKGLAPGDYVRVAVSDTGVGMDERTAARAVEPFFTTKGPGKGTGLGLSMVHGLVAQSGGAMRIVSACGRGTTVEIYLQRASAETADPRPRRASGVEPREYKVMVVDHDSSVLAGTIDMLTDAGQIAVACSSGAEALDILRSGTRVDVVVTDFAMPTMDGAELARIVRAQWDIPVILVSGYVECPNGGDIPWLCKPYNVERLMTLIDRVLSQNSGSDGAVA